MEVLTLNQVRDILYKEASLDVDSLPLDAVRDCYDFLREFAADKVIYGINTGFGPMAQWRVDDRYLEDLQYNIIRSHSCGAGEALEDIYVKSAMIARLGVFLQCRSGIHPEVCRLLVEFINRGIYPYIPMHGSVGASGDLVQLAHLALTLIGEGKVHYRGEWRKTAEVMEENGLKPISIHVREGLSVTNGTSVMTGISVVNQFRAEQLTEWALLASVMMNEIASSFDDLMSEELNSCRRRPHYRRQQPQRLYLRPHPCGRPDSAWLGHCAGRSQLPVPRSEPAFQRFPDPGRRRHHHLCQGNPQPYCWLIRFPQKGRSQRPPRREV